MFRYNLVVSRGYILLISIYPMLKAGKLHSITSIIILVNLFKNYFMGAKICWIFAQLYKHSTDCFVLEVSTVDNVSRILNRIYIGSQEKEKK